MRESGISKQSTFVLKTIALVFVLIVFRLFFLVFVEYEHHYQKSKLPRSKVQLTEPARGTIRDRYNIPLAINRLQYDVAVVFGDIRNVAKTVTVYENGEKKRIAQRKGYIEEFARFLSTYLQVDPLEIEDKIYSEAALFPHSPCILQREISEELYYKLKSLELYWPGLKMMKNPKRFYPYGKVAADLIGHVGPIQLGEWKQAKEAIRTLELFLALREHGDPAPLPQGYNSIQEVECAIDAYKSKIASMSTLVGKKGIEKLFEIPLRGQEGKDVYEINTSGKLLKKLPGSTDPSAGKRVILSLSVELQAYAEALLAYSEKVRDESFHEYGKDHSALPPPWIKGGAIIAMLPKTGEVVAMASYPRVNLNDFIPSSAVEKRKARQAATLRMLEGVGLVEKLWDGKMDLYKELYSMETCSYQEVFQPLTWSYFIRSFLGKSSSVLKAIESVKTVRDADEILSAFSLLLELSEQSSSLGLLQAIYPTNPVYKGSCVLSLEAEKEIISSLQQHEDLFKEKKLLLDRYFSKIPHHHDKLLFLDILHACFPYRIPHEELSGYLSTLSLERFRFITQEWLKIQEKLQGALRQSFQTRIFPDWREKHFPSYLKAIRALEKKEKRKEKPYTYYLKKVSDLLFEEFVTDHFSLAVEALFFHQPCESYIEPFLKQLADLQTSPLASLFRDLGIEKSKLLQSLLIPFSKMNEPLFGSYRRSLTQKDLIGMCYPKHGFGFGKSFAYKHAAPQGSIFKIVTAYEALIERFFSGLDLNPLTIVDESNSRRDIRAVLGTFADGTPIPRLYKGGVLPRSATPPGKIDLSLAMVHSSNTYFSLLASDHIASAERLKEAAENFGFGQKTGIEVEAEYSGELPHDLRDNRTGLYSFAIGQHSLTVTPIQTATFLCSLANGGDLPIPSIVLATAGEKKERPEDSLEAPSFPFDYAWAQLGIYFPIYTQLMQKQKTFHVEAIPRKIRSELLMPHEVRSMLLESMRRVLADKNGGAHPFRIKLLYKNPMMLRSYTAIKDSVVGKTSTAQFYFHPTIDKETAAVLSTDIWFGAISFASPINEGPFKIAQRYSEPELVVVVYLRHGDFGKEAAPYALEMIKKWREIQKKEGRSLPAPLKVVPAL